MIRTENEREIQRGGWAAVAEIGLIFLIFFLWAGWPPPDTNEAHYLAKAKHYWQPQWCAGDLFLESADAHLVFYWTFGWLNLLLSLPAVAWIGRLVTWGLLAWAWRSLSYAAIPRPFVSLLTASLFVLFNQHFHMAGEWVVGGVEAKGFAYVLVFFALAALLRNRWNRAWILLGLATSFHALVGGWSLVAAGCAWLACGSVRPPLRSLWPGMAVGAVLALAGLIPVLTLDAQTPPDVVRQATSIYVYHRLDHHLVFHRFDHGYMARHALLAVIWLAAAWCTPCQLSAGSLGQRPLRGFVGGAVAIALVGILIDQTTLHHLDVAAVLLKYYWYRLCDAVLPVGASLAVVGWILSLQDRRPVAAQGALVAAVLAAAVGVGLTNYVRRCDLRPGADRQLLPAWEDAPHRTRRTFEDWRHVCDWIARHTPPDACFITPRMQQTFKWYAGRSEVCSWKDVPQDAASVVAWWERHLEIYPRRVVVGGLVAHGEDRLRALADKYGADYVVLDRYAGPRRLLYPRVYPPGFETTSSSYEVYRIPRAP